MHITVKHQVLAAHFWGDAPANRAYLSLPHAHMFHFSMDVNVSDPDRQVEYHDAMRHLVDGIFRVEELANQSNQPMVGELFNFGGLSCESIGLMLLADLSNHLPVQSITVSEDNLVSSTVTQRDLVKMAMEGEESSFKINFKAAQVSTNGPTRTVTPWDFSTDYALKSRPPMVTICGSTKFKDETLQAIAMMEHRKHMCLSVGYFAHAEAIQLDEQEKIQLDELHKWKIIHSDYIYVVNPGGYIGSSTRSEIEFANHYGIPVEYLEPPQDNEDEYIRAVQTAEAVAALTPEELASRMLWRYPSRLIEATGVETEVDARAETEALMEILPNES